MTRRALLAMLDIRRIEEAIRAAERETSGELRVSVAGLFWGDCERMAARAFERLGMSRTREGNAVLLVLIPWRRRVVIHADAGIHQRVPGNFWREIVVALTAAFAEGRHTEGVVAAVAEIGRALATHYPPRPDDNPNELPDRVHTG